MIILKLKSGYTDESERPHVARIQRIVGAYDDGFYGPKTEAAVKERLVIFNTRYSGAVTDETWQYLLDLVGYRPIAWGKEFDSGERQKVREIAFGLEANPDDIMNAIAFETGESFNPKIRNMAGSGATGLIQFMPATAQALGTSIQQLLEMNVHQQLTYVYRYLLPFKGRLTSLAEVYMAILYPIAVGKERNYKLFRRGSTAYRQNMGLDVDQDADIEKWEAVARVRGKVAKGNRRLG